MKEKLKQKKEKKRLQLGGPRKVCLEWWVGEPMWANLERRRFGRNWIRAAAMMIMMLPLPSFPNPSYDLFFLYSLFSIILLLLLFFVSVTLILSSYRKNYYYFISNEMVGFRNFSSQLGPNGIDCVMIKNCE